MDNQEKPLPQLAQETNEDCLILDEEQLEDVTGGAYGTIAIKTGASGFFGVKKEFPNNVVLGSPSRIATPNEAKNKVFAKQNEQIYAGQSPSYRLTFPTIHGKTVPLAWNGERPTTI